MQLSHVEVLPCAPALPSPLSQADCGAYRQREDTSMCLSPSPSPHGGCVHEPARYYSSLTGRMPTAAPCTPALSCHLGPAAAAFADKQAEGSSTYSSSQQKCLKAPKGPRGLRAPLLTQTNHCWQTGRKAALPIAHQRHPRAPP